MARSLGPFKRKAKREEKGFFTDEIYIEVKERTPLVPRQDREGEIEKERV